MTFASSIVLLLVVIAALGVVAFAFLSPRRRTRIHRGESRLRGPRDPISDPPTITHYGHA